MDDTKITIRFYISIKRYKEVKPWKILQQGIMILIDNSDMVIEQPEKIQNESGGSEEVVVLDVKEVEVKFHIENDEEEDATEGLQIPNKASNDRAIKIPKMINPKSFRKQNGVTKRMKARDTEHTSILF